MHPRTAAGDRGDTLVEVVAATVLVSLTSVALFSALATAAGLAGRARSDVLLDSVVRRAADGLVAAGRRCVPGAPLTLDPAGGGGTSSNIDVSFRDVAGSAPVCPAAGTTVTVEVTARVPGGAIDRATVIVGPMTAGAP